MATYQEFFEELMRVLREEHGFTGARKAQPSDNWYDFASGYGQRVKYYARFPSGGRVSIELYIGSDDKDWNKELFDQLEERKGDLESDFGETFKWERKNRYKSSEIRVVRPGSIEDDEETLREIREWMVERLLKFKQVFGPRLDELVELVV